MSQKILTVIFFILLVIFGILYYFYENDNIFKSEIKSFDATLSKTDSEGFQYFLYENKGKFVKISVILSDEMKKEMLNGVDSDNKITFTAKDGENKDRDVKYVIRLPDNGRFYFDYDVDKGRLSGYFKTYRRVAPDGSPVINLVPIPPKLLQNIDKTKK